MRMMLKMQPIDNEWVPVRIFDSTNIGSVSLTTGAFQSGAWYGDSSYQHMFETLWRG
jgi:hypothetical protein